MASASGPRVPASRLPRHHVRQPRHRRHRERRRFHHRAMVGDTAALIEQLVGGPVRIVGVSMGSFIAQELMLVRPELVSQAVLMATRGRHDRARDVLPPRRTRTARRRRRPSRPSTTPKSGCWRTSRRRRSTTTARCATGWRCSPCGPRSRPRACAPSWRSRPRQPAARLPGNPAPALVIGFADDVLLPPHLGREVADALPNGRYLRDSRRRAPRFHRTSGRRQRRDAGILRRARV